MCLQLWRHVVMKIDLFVINRCLWACGHQNESILWPEPKCCPLLGLHAPHGGIHDYARHRRDEPCQSGFWLCQESSRIAAVRHCTGFVFRVHLTTAWYVLLFLKALKRFKVMYWLLSCRSAGITGGRTSPKFESSCLDRPSPRADWKSSTCTPQRRRFCF